MYLHDDDIIISLTPAGPSHLLIDKGVHVNLHTDTNYLRVRGVEGV
jgi:hypothetical protein